MASLSRFPSKSQTSFPPASLTAGDTEQALEISLPWLDAEGEAPSTPPSWGERLTAQASWRKSSLQTLPWSPTTRPFHILAGGEVLEFCSQFLVLYFEIQTGWSGSWIVSISRTTWCLSQNFSSNILLYQHSYSGSSGQLSTVSQHSQLQTFLAVLTPAPPSQHRDSCLRCQYCLASPGVLQTVVPARAHEQHPGAPSKCTFSVQPDLLSQIPRVRGGPALRVWINPPRDPGAHSHRRTEALATCSLSYFPQMSCQAFMLFIPPIPYGHLTLDSQQMNVQIHITNGELQIEVCQTSCHQIYRPTCSSAHPSFLLKGQLFHFNCPGATGWWSLSCLMSNPMLPNRIFCSDENVTYACCLRQ